MIDIEQKIEICLKSKRRELGVFSISAPYNYINSPTKKFNDIKLYNVPESTNSNKIPLQYQINPSEESANIILLEETRYTIRFLSDEKLEAIKFPSLENYGKDNFSKLSKDDNPFIGILNTGSFIGKSFFDVEIGGFKSERIPFEVRSKKIDYEIHYPAMISDLCEAASGIVFKSSPVFEPQKLKEIVRKTFYEDFIFFEYLFRPENLITAYEHIRRDPHKTLKRYNDSVPLALAQSIGPSEVIDMVSDPANLYKPRKIPLNWPEKLNDHVPHRVMQTFHEDIVDNPENRFVKYFLQIVNEFLDEMINFVNENGQDSYAADKIYYFKNIIHEYLLDGWLEDIGELNYFPSNSQVLQKKEGYRDILRFFMVLESAFFLSLDEIEELLKGYQRKLYDLYEYWCYIKLFKVLSNMSIDDLDYNRLFNKSNDKEWSVNLKRGENSLQKFEIKIEEEIVIVELLYNREFNKKSIPRSYSLNLRPDYTLRIKRNNKVFLIHFDAKYRSNILYDNEVERYSKEEEEKRIYKNADVYKMHTYKDAIIDSLGAYVLYPGKENNNETIFYEKPNQILPSVGAFPLTPGNDDSEEDNIEKFIRKSLSFIFSQQIDSESII